MGPTIFGAQQIGPWHIGPLENVGVVNWACIIDIIELDILSTIEEYLSVELIHWYLAYSSHNCVDICQLEMSVCPMGAEWGYDHCTECVNIF